MPRVCGVLQVLRQVERRLEPSSENVRLLALLAEEFEKALELVRRYGQASWLRKALAATDMRESFSEQDRRLTALVADLAAGMGSEVLNELTTALPCVSLLFSSLCFASLLFFCSSLLSLLSPLLPPLLSPLPYPLRCALARSLTALAQVHGDATRGHPRRDRQLPRPRLCGGACAWPCTDRTVHAARAACAGVAR